MNTTLTLLRGDFADMPVASQHAICQEIVATIEAKAGDARSHVEHQELQGLRDLRDHCAQNLARARAAHPWTAHAATIRCHRCGATVDIPTSPTHQ